MERQKIYNAYEQITPGEDSRAKMLDNILARASEISPMGKDANMKHIHRRSVLIAAIVIIMLVTMGAAVVHLRVADLHMGEYVKPEYTFTDDEGKEVTIPEVTRDRISMQGIKDSPNQKAVQEWLEFRDSYDHDYKLLHEADDNGFICPEAYHAYGVYTQEMIAKVDEIAEKYNLKLAGPITIVQREDSETFFDSLGIERLHRTDADIEIEYHSGYFYRCGNFNFSYRIKDTETGYKFDCSTHYSDKAYLDVVHFAVKNIETLEQFNYTTADGTDTLILLGDDWARIFCDRDDAFFTVFIRRIDLLTGDFAYIKKEEAELIADSLDFSIKPQV